MRLARANLTDYSSTHQEPVEYKKNKNFLEVPTFDVPANETDVRVITVFFTLGMAALPLYLAIKSVLIPLIALTLLAKLSWSIAQQEKIKKDNYLRSYIVQLYDFSDDALIRAAELSENQLNRETLINFVAYKRFRSNPSGQKALN